MQVSSLFKTRKYRFPKISFHYFSHFCLFLCGKLTCQIKPCQKDEELINKEPKGNIQLKQFKLPGIQDYCLIWNLYVIMLQMFNSTLRYVGFVYTALNFSVDINGSWCCGFTQHIPASTATDQGRETIQKTRDYPNCEQTEILFSIKLLVSHYEK